MGASSASGYVNNFTWVSEAVSALKSVLGALWGGKIFSAKINPDRPGLDGTALDHEVRVRVPFGARRNMK